MKKLPQDKAKKSVLSDDSRYSKHFWPIMRIVGLEAEAFLSYLINWESYVDKQMYSVRQCAEYYEEDWDYDSPWFWVTIQQAKIDTDLSREMQDKWINKLVAFNLIRRDVKPIFGGTKMRFFKINYNLINNIVNLKQWKDDREAAQKISMNYIVSSDVKNDILDTVSMREKLIGSKSKSKKKTDTMEEENMPESIDTHIVSELSKDLSATRGGCVSPYTSNVSESQGGMWQEHMGVCGRNTSNKLNNNKPYNNKLKHISPAELDDNILNANDLKKESKNET
jgi:hypothetical protein